MEAVDYEFELLACLFAATWHAKDDPAVAERASARARLHVSAADFTERQHRLLFEYMTSNTKDELDERYKGFASEPWAPEMFRRLREHYGNYGSVENWAKLLARAGKIRRIKDALGALMADVQDIRPEVEGDVELFVTAAQRALTEAAGDTAFGQTKIDKAAIGREILALYYEGRRYDGVQLGLSKVDETLGGLNAGNMCVVAARPGRGKTTLAFQAALNVAGSGRQVMFVSLEMSARELCERAICNLAGISLRQLRSGTHELAVREQSDYLLSLPLDILTPTERTLDIVRGEIQGAKECPALVVIDYLQLIRVQGKFSGLYEKITYISQSIKVLARESGVPIIAVCQLNREAEKSDRAPKLSDLRDSGQIEQDADQVLLLSDDGKKDDVTSLYCDVAKNRHGPTGKATLSFNRPLFRVENGGIESMVAFS